MPLLKRGQEEVCQVLDVGLHLVVYIVRDVLVGASVTATVGYRMLFCSEGIHLVRPRSPVANCAVDENNGLAVTLLNVFQSRTIDFSRRHSYPSLRLAALSVSFPSAGAVLVQD